MGEGEGDPASPAGPCSRETRSLASRTDSEPPEDPIISLLWGTPWTSDQLLAVIGAESCPPPQPRPMRLQAAGAQGPYLSASHLGAQFPVQSLACSRCSINVCLDETMVPSARESCTPTPNSGNSVLGFSCLSGSLLSEFSL